MVNYKDDNGKSIQAFLVNYKMELMESFDPDDYLDGINRKLGDVDNLADANTMPTISETIDIPGLVPAPMEDTTTVNLNTMLGQLTTSMTGSLKQQISVPLVTGGNGTNITTQPIDIFDFNGSNFETLKFYQGQMVLTLTLTSGSGGAPNNIAISLNGVGLTENDKPNTNSISNGTPNPVTLNSTTTTATVTIDLAGKTIYTDNTKKPVFRLGTVTDNSTAQQGTQFNMGISVTVQNLKIQGATGLNSINPITIEIPSSLSDIDLGTLPPEFIHAEIGAGQLTIDGELPTDKTSGDSWFEGFAPAYDINITQAGYTSTVDNKPYNGLTYDSANPAATAWNITSANTPMQGKHLSPEDINIITAAGGTIPQSKITVSPPTGASFMLSNTDAGNGNIDIDLEIKMEITKLAKVHWNMENAIPNPTIPPIDLTDASKFVKTIYYDPYEVTGGTVVNGVELNLNFTSFPLQDFVMVLTSIDPDFPLEPIHMGGELGVGDNIYRNTVPIELDLKDNAGAPKKLEFDVDLKPINGAKVVEIADLTPGVALDIQGEVTFTQKWKEADVDLKEALKESNKDTDMLEGSFPKPGQTPVDLSSMSKFLDGFTFSGIEAKLFLQGPKGLMEAMEPTLEFQAKYENKAGITEEFSLLELDKVELKHHVYETLPALPPKNADGEYVYEDTALPPDGIELSDKFGGLLADSPKNLSFEYTMGLPPFITVTPETFNNVDNGSSSGHGIHARVLILMPLILEAKDPSGATLDLKEMFKTDGNAKTTDLFGRKKDSKTGKPTGSIFDDININSLKMSLEFDAELFSGGILKIDEANNLFKDGIPLTGKIINLEAGGPEMKIIQENMIYPHIRLQFPQAAQLKIPRNLVPVRLDITASGSYIIDLTK
jgi:hypothetical protein